MRRPLLLIFPAYCLGILFAGYLPLPLWLLFFWGSFSVFFAVWAEYRKWMLASCLMIWAVMLAGLIRMSAVSALPEHFIGNFVQETPVQVEGVVDDVLDIRKEGQGKTRVLYVVAVRQVVNESGRHAAEGKIRLSVRQTTEQLLCQIGDRISVRGIIQLPRPGSNPGDPNYRAYFSRHGIGAVMNSTAKDLKVADEVVWYYPLRKMRQIRESLSGAMTGHMGETEAAMLKGLVFGERTDIPAEIAWDFADTGLVHILSVSGFHVAIIAGVIYALLRSMHCAETTVLKVAMLCIGCYVLLVGFSPPVLRSAAMAAVLMGASLFLRKKDTLQALLVAGWLLLIWDPRQIYDIGFQLSFAATAGLIVLSPRIEELFGKRVPARVKSAIATTIAATLAVLPMLADYFQQISLISLLANLLLTLPVSLLIVSGLVAAILGSIWSPLAYTVIVFNNWLTGVIVRVTDFLAHVPFASVHIAAFPWWLSVAYYILLAWVCQLYTPFFLPPFPHIWHDPRRRALFVGTCTVLLLVYHGYAGLERGLVVTFLNVGQGDAALIRTPHNYSILIDGGGGSREDGTGYDTGEKIIIPFLRREGVRDLDFVILSHGHEDHAGGLRMVLRHLPVKGLLAPADLSTAKQISAILDICRERSIPVFTPVNGQRIDIDGVSVEVLSPEGVSAGSDQANETSVAVKVIYGGHCFLFTGDLEGEAEQKLLQNGDVLAGTVLKVGHHGSGNGTSQAFLEKVHPIFAVISVGEGNPYGHPAAAVLQRLQDCHVRIFRTDRDGAVSFWSDGRRMSVKTYMQN